MIPVYSTTVLYDYYLAFQDGRVQKYCLNYCNIDGIAVYHFLQM